MTKQWVEYHDAVPDDYGRRKFTLHWVQNFPNSPQHQPVLFDGKTIFPRAQAFFGVPDDRVSGCVEGVPPWSSDRIQE